MKITRLRISCLVLASVLFLASAMGCEPHEAHGEAKHGGEGSEGGEGGEHGGGGHGGGHHGHGTPELLVTTPLRKEVEITQDYVAQVHAIQHIEMRAMEHGYLQDIFVDEGQIVKKGDLMFRTMPVLYRAEVKKAEAEAEFATIEYKNTKMLHAENVVSTNELAMAKARLDRAKADVAMARAHLTMSEIRAPFNGIMNRLHVRQGSLLEEGELLTTLSDNSKMWVYFNVTEAEYLDYMMEHKGEEPTPVKLLMANYKMFPHEGKIETIEADFNHETGNIAFRATFPNPDGLLRHGETGKVIMATPIPNALIIPQKATFEILDKKFVFVVDSSNKVHLRQITVAEEIPHLYVVSEGLEEADRILVEGLRKVRDGDAIVPKVEDPEKVIASLDVPAE